MGILNLRGLFENIFGKRPGGGSTFPEYRLLSSCDSSFTPFNGRAWGIATVHAAVDAWARNAAKIQPRHIRCAGGRRENVSGGLERILQTRPKPDMTAYAVPYEHLVHLQRYYLDNNIFEDGNRPILPTLNTANAFNQSMSKFAKLVSVIWGISGALTVTKNEDLSKRWDEFVKDNFSMKNSGSGVIITDSKRKYTSIQQMETPIPTGQLEFVRREIYDYFGVSEEIVQNRADAFYCGQLASFLYAARAGAYKRQFHRKRSWFRERDTLDKRTEAAKFLTDIGALTLDRVLDIFDFAPIGGEEGAQRVQTLNMVNTTIPNAYQMTSAGQKAGNMLQDKQEPPAGGGRTQRGRKMNRNWETEKTLMT